MRSKETFYLKQLFKYKQKSSEPKIDTKQNLTKKASVSLRQLCNLGKVL